MLGPQRNRKRRNDATSNAFASAALASTSTSHATIDPATVAAEIFGSSVDLEDRDAVLSLLESVLPLDADGTVSNSIVPRAAFTSPQTSATAWSGPYAPFYLTTQNLSASGTLLKEIRPLSEFSGAACDYRTLIGLIQITVSQLVSQAGQPDGPTGGTVSALLQNLAGYTPRSTSFDVNSIAGLIGKLRDSAGIQMTYRCSPGDERIVASFSSYVALVGAVVRAWDEVQTTGGTEYLSTAGSAVLRSLSAISSDLRKLLEVVDDHAWPTTVLRTSPPMVAGEFFNWVWRYVSTQAPQLLQYGESGFSLVAQTMQTIAGHLSTGFLSSAPSATDVSAPLRTPIEKPAQDCADPSFDIAVYEVPGNPCDDIPFAFSDDEVTSIVKSTLCQIQQILDVARSIASPQAVIKSARVVNAENEAISYASQGDTVYLNVCGNALELVSVYAKGEDGKPCSAVYDSAFQGGVRYRLDLGKASTGCNDIYVGEKPVAELVVTPAAGQSRSEEGKPIESSLSSPDASSATRKSAPRSKA